MIKFPDNEKVPDWKALEVRLDYSFLDKGLLRQAFSHRSRKANSSCETYERLEFLGDRVLGLAVSHWLFREFWQKAEGELASFMTMVVNNKSLSKLAKKLGLGEYLILSSGEESKGGKENYNILADALEALTGAIFIDGGWNQAERFLEKHILSEIPAILASASEFNPKGKLQELAQDKFRIAPSYRVLEETEVKTSKSGRWYVVAVYLNGVLIGKAEGESKQGTHEKAAINALKETAELTRLPLALLRKRDVVEEILFR